MHVPGLAPLHNPRSPLLSVPVGPAVKIASSRRWVPELRFPRKEPWRRAQVLELDFSKVDKSGEDRCSLHDLRRIQSASVFYVLCCGLAADALRKTASVAHLSECAWCVMNSTSASCLPWQEHKRQSDLLSLPET